MSEEEKALAKAETDKEALAKALAKAETDKEALAKALTKALAKAETDKEEALAKAVGQKERQLREEGYGGGVYSQDECPICLDGLYSQRCSILPCFHMLHTTCWFLTSRRFCPVCRDGPG